MQPINVLEQEVLNIQRGEKEIIEQPEVVLPPEYSEKIIEKEYSAPKREVYYQPIVERQVVNQTEEVKFIPQAEQVVNLTPLQRELKVRDREKIETVVRPGREITRDTFVLPIVQKESVELDVRRGEDKRVQLDPITEATQINNVVRSKNINIPGKEVITQPIVQEYFQQNDIYHVQNPIYERVPVQRNIAIPMPVLEKVPIIRRIPIKKPKRQGGTYTHKVNINLPNKKKKDSSEDVKSYYYSDEETEYVPQGNEASWIQEGLDKAFSNK